MIKPIIVSPRKSLNKAFLKLKPNRTEIELFKANLSTLLDRINENESEEFHKNLVADFFKNTYYAADHFINTKGRNDLVIHIGKEAKTNVGVIIEAKSPTNKNEMLKKDNLNNKAFHELILYYLRERITVTNIEIKHLIATNIYDWYIFDARDFDKLFAQNKHLVKQFTDFEEKRLASTDTSFFYKEIAEKFVSQLETDISFTHFDIRDFEKPLRNPDKKDDNVLIALYKLLSPQHLLKQAFLNDSNSLDKTFYSELLHIIGLEETKDGNKKLIGRKSTNRNNGSLIENAIIQLETLDKISRITNPSQFGNNTNERLFNVSLELVITWVNRILFLKLLEAQLVSYHKGDKNYEFLNTGKIKDFDELNSLFFRVLARKPDERSEDVSKLFATVPYLNSSLFEPTELEHQTIFISSLRNESKIPILSNTVLKDATGKKRNGGLNPLEYIFEFLNAYDFSSEGSEDIQEENKTLINASVLGLIFEKINGYKDGSFFTPGFITMYMCRETIRRAVLQKFKEVKNLDCTSIDQLYNKIDDKPEANKIINSLKICDPAVGSGHFLVSALNEIIAIKSELKILCDSNGKTLRDYSVEVVNDELAITDEDGKPFEYNPNNAESRRVQETLFHEKQTIIENCLFGVDINPNSVKICRLRLWIELLKNAYYKAPDFKELETLPNIDINIKCGNSLISRYALDSDIKAALKKSKWSVDSYRLAVMTYRNAQSKDEKREMEKLIGQIKNDFESEVAINDKRVIRLRKLKADLLNLTTQTSLFEKSKAEKTAWNKQVNLLTADVQKLETEIEQIKSNKIYENAFEWRFEFPEVLNDEGDFVGFDVVIGNPPYFIMTKHNTDKNLLYAFLNEYMSIKSSNSKNIFPLFIEKGISILNRGGYQSFIVPEGLFITRSYADCVKFMESNGNSENITTIEGMVFDEANTGNVIFIFGKNSKTPTKKFHFNSNKELATAKIEDVSVIEKIFSLDTIVQLKDICELFKGMVIHDRKHYVYDKWNANLPDMFLLGNCISKWVINNNKYTDYDSITIIGGTKLKSKHDTFPRILIRRTGDFLCCAYLEEAALTESTLYSCWSINSSYENKYILALLHSKLFDYFIKKMMVTNKQAFPQILLTDIGNLPIMNVCESDQEKLIVIVDNILETKKENHIADTSDMEKEIDLLVYELYGLTEEEIKIVEGK